LKAAGKKKRRNLKVKKKKGKEEKGEASVQPPAITAREETN